MKLQIGNECLTLPEGAEVLKPPTRETPSSFAALTEQALDHPLDREPLGCWKLDGKRITILIDDWGRPTPCSEFLPAVLCRLHQAGARREDITILTASGMHDPMSASELERKVGREVFLRYRCISHDAGDPNQLAFLGVTPLGTPVWVNRRAAEADVRISLGRVFPHICYGYEGGYKMVVPGIASFETIMRDHALNFSAYSTYASIERNPSRAEADAVGRMLSIHLMVGFVMDWDSRPVAAVAGTVERAFREAVWIGQRRVWGAVCKQPADIAILSAKQDSRQTLSENPTYYMGMALQVVKPDGILIVDTAYRAPAPIVVEGIDMHQLPMDQLYFQHERRNWQLPPREIQKAVKAIRGAFYYRRIFELCPQKLFFASDTYPASVLERWQARSFPTVEKALQAAVTEKGKEAHIVAIADGAHTLPLLQYDFETQAQKRSEMS